MREAKTEQAKTYLVLLRLWLRPTWMAPVSSCSSGGGTASSMRTYLFFRPKNPGRPGKLLPPSGAAGSAPRSPMVDRAYFELLARSSSKI